MGGPGSPLPSSLTPGHASAISWHKPLYHKGGLTVHRGTRGTGGHRRQAHFLYHSRASAPPRGGGSDPVKASGQDSRWFSRYFNIFVEGPSFFDKCFRGFGWVLTLGARPKIQQNLFRFKLYAMSVPEALIAFESSRHDLLF